MESIDFTSYSIFVFAVTGILLLLEDVSAYKIAGLKKERKTAKILGWVNISLGLMLFLADLILKQWFW
ncbi:CLC_0170 family protein [Bacillus dakarensis]|uniref:CLC_0170 family protein n=1 Tax=Robertmurraya dakarensis TaxID=1926278 RepID=UPI000980FF04|nr:CLC_0170 family protein [Bacillus dakarensis]